MNRVAVFRMYFGEMITRTNMCIIKVLGLICVLRCVRHTSYTRSYGCNRIGGVKNGEETESKRQIMQKQHVPNGPIGYGVLDKH